jgi:hypothetical protein
MSVCLVYEVDPKIGKNVVVVVSNEEKAKDWALSLSFHLLYKSVDLISAAEQFHRILKTGPGVDVALQISRVIESSAEPDELQTYLNKLLSKLKLSQFTYEEIKIETGKHSPKIVPSLRPVRAAATTAKKKIAAIARYESDDELEFVSFPEFGLELKGIPEDCLSGPVLYFVRLWYRPENDGRIKPMPVLKVGVTKVDFIVRLKAVAAACHSDKVEVVALVPFDSKDDAEIMEKEIKKALTIFRANLDVYKTELFSDSAGALRDGLAIIRSDPECWIR